MSTPITLPDCAQKLIERLYPTVDWNRVTFLKGLPWWQFIGSAITLPDPLDPWRFRVYLGNDTDFCSSVPPAPEALSTLVHEAYHIAQFMSVAGGYGIGFLRPGFVAYFACHFAYGSYEKNPFEVIAKEQERERFKPCYLHSKVCNCATGGPVFDAAALDDLVACNPELVVERPVAPRCRAWQPLAYLLIGLFASFGIFAHLFDRVQCKWLKQVSQECRKWGQETRAECVQWAETSSEQCTQWADQGYEQCNDWADEGYETCGQWADWGYNACCTWWPCSWGCKALVWISNVVCVALVWVSKMVCKLLVWISNVVCQVTVFVVSLVCLVLVTIVQLVCQIWATVTRFVLLCWI